MGRDVPRPDQAQRPRRAAEGRGGPEPPGATRSADGREHGEDGEDRTLRGASTVANAGYVLGLATYERPSLHDCADEVI